MFAQLVGIPGSGKSSVAARLAAQHPDCVAHVVVHHERVGRLLWRHPRTTLAALLNWVPVVVIALFAKGSVAARSDRLAPLSALLNLMVRYRQLERRQPTTRRILLFDEFVEQRILGIFAHSTGPVSRATLRWTLFWLRRYEATPIYLAIDAGEAQKRVEQREEGWPPRWDRLDPSVRSDILERQQTALSDLYLFSPGGYWIGCEGGIDEVAERVLAALDARSSPRRPRPTIGHFVFNLSRYSGAAGQARLLAARVEGFDPIFFSAERDRRTASFARVEDSSLRVLYLPRNPLRAFLVIADFSFTHRIRLFHIHGFIGAGLLSGWILRRRLILKSTLLDSDDFGSMAGRAGGPFLLWLARRAHRNIAPSSAIAEVNRRHAPNALIQHLPNGVQTSGALSPRASAKRAPIFCVVGLVCERKRTHLAIEKFLASHARDAKAKLYVVGPFGDQAGLDEGDERYLAHCRSLIPASRVDKVVWTGSLPREELRSIYEESLALLCFSRFEGLPNVLLEAMAANCVPVTTEIEGVAREVVPDERSGFVIGDDEALPSLAQLVECSAALGPRRRAEAAFSIDGIAREYERIYSEMLERPRGSR